MSTIRGFLLNALGQKNFSHAIKLGIKKPADFVQDKIIPAPICERFIDIREIDMYAK